MDEYTIDHVRSMAELREVYAFADAILELGDDRPFDFYEEPLAHTPQLLIFARRGGQICGCVLGVIDGDHVLASAVAVAEDVRRMGIGSAMMHELESRTRALGHDTIILGAKEEAEPFYLSCGFHSNLFIQLPEGSAVARLKALNDRYAVVWEWEDAEMSKLMLGLPRIDKPLQRAYERAFPTCSTQVVFIKHV